jgi:DNA-binding beta-propeller fold protein YncE
MLKIDNFLTFRSEIKAIKSLNKTDVAIVSQHNGIKVFSPTEQEQKNSFNNKLISSKTRDIAFSDDGEYFAIANMGDKNIHIFHIESKKHIKTIKTPHEISKLIFDNSSRYIFASTISGRVLQYKIDNSTLLARVCSFISNTKRQSYVSALFNYKHLLATAGFGDKIYIINTHSNQKTELISSSKARVTSFAFKNNSELISANIEGLIEVYDLFENKNIYQIETPFTNIAQICLVPNSDFILIHNKENSIALLNYKTKKIVKHKYIDVGEKISVINMHSEAEVIIGLLSGKVLRVQLPNRSLLLELIQQNRYEDAYDLIEYSEVLKSSREYKRLENLYSSSFKNCVDALSKQNHKLAEKSIEKFIHIGSKKGEIKELFKAFENYPRLQILYLEKKLPLAFALCNKHQALKHTFQYQKLNEAWIEHFKDAQRQLTLGRLKDAKAILSVYNTVISKRELIQAVLHNSKEFLVFIKHFEDKNYTESEKILSKFPIFASAPTYTPEPLDVEKTIANIESLIVKSDFASAKKEIINLKNNTQEVAAINKLIKKLKLSSTLQKYYDNNDFFSCYKILDLNLFLINTELGTFLEKHWYKLMQESEEYALKGDIKNVKKTMGELLTLTSRTEKTGSFLRISFHIKIKQLMAKKNYKTAESLIYSYIDIFGLDNEMQDLMRQFETLSKLKLALSEGQNQRPARDAWVDSKITQD